MSPTLSSPMNTVTAASSPTAPATTPVITSKNDSNSTRARVNVEARYQTLIAGIAANLSDVATFVLPTGTFSRDDLVARLQTRIAAAEATKSAKTAWHTAVQAERQVDSTVRVLRQGLQQYVASRYGASSTKLAEFGFAPLKPRKTTASTKAGAAEKAKATRTARHTMGKQQKKAIVAPPSPAAAPSPPAPAPTAVTPSPPAVAPAVSAAR